MVTSPLMFITGGDSSGNSPKPGTTRCFDRMIWATASVVICVIGSLAW